MNAVTLAKNVAEKYGTSDVLAIAEKAGVKIVYAKWFPVTIGEFDKKNLTITVNLNGVERLEKVIAHELGHFFALDLKLDKKEDEIFARTFADALLKNFD